MWDLLVLLGDLFYQAIHLEVQAHLVDKLPVENFGTGLLESRVGEVELATEILLKSALSVGVQVVELFLLAQLRMVNERHVRLLACDETS